MLKVYLKEQPEMFSEKAEPLSNMTKVLWLSRKNVSLLLILFSLRT